MKRTARFGVWGLSLLLLAGCQVTHTLKEPSIAPQPQLPAINVQVMGAVPSHWVRNELRRVGVFENVGEGHSPSGYNVLVTTSANYMGAHNIPKMLLSALTLFTVPAPVSWDGRMQFQVSRGEQKLVSYDIANQSRQLMGLFVNPDGRGANTRVIVDEFVQRLQKDAAIFRVPMITPIHSPQPVAPPGLSSDGGRVTLNFTVRADGTVGDIQAVENDWPELVKAATDAVSQWRFEPWSVEVGIPRELRISKSFSFGSARSDLSSSSSDDYISNLLTQPCSAINDELAAFRKAHPQESLKNMQSFKYTSAALFLVGLSQEKDVGKITQMSSRFDANLPWLIDQCQANPTESFKTYVTEAMRR